MPPDYVLYVRTYVVRIIVLSDMSPMPLRFSTAIPSRMASACPVFA
jgi:hypothetical protein